MNFYVKSYDILTVLQISKYNKKKKNFMQIQFEYNIKQISMTYIHCIHSKQINILLHT